MPVKNSLNPSENNNLNFRLTCDQVVHIETAGNVCISRPDVKKPLKQEMAFILQEKGYRYIIAKTYQINKRENERFVASSF